MKRDKLNRNIVFFVNLLEKSALFLAVFLVTVMILTSLLFFIKISISIYHLPFSFLFASLAFYFICKEKRSIKLFSITLATLVIICSMYVNNRFYDVTWDGNTYHKEAVGLLKKGWNPLYEDYLSFNEKIERDMSYIGNDIDMKPGMWSTHYAKGVWFVNANFYILTNNIEAAKVFNPIMIF